MREKEHLIDNLARQLRLSAASYFSPDVELYGVDRAFALICNRDKLNRSEASYFWEFVTLFSARREGNPYRRGGKNGLDTVVVKLEVTAPCDH